ncbi:MAG: AMP-binding protein, partial [Planctomycetota bacterium]|nr:AMP-binding protein [Planctomycetota bacterium]
GRSAGAVLATLAVWRAGLAYVPLDPADSPERRAAALDDLRHLTGGRPATVLHVDSAPELPGGTPTIALEELLAELEAEASGAAAPPPELPAVAPEDLAYVLFTSGSTGRPKGVRVPHRALANHVAWGRAAFGFTPEDRFLLRTPLGFDASIWELVHPLAAGATLVVASAETGRDGHDLLALAAAESITVVQTVPSILRAWLAEPGFDRQARRR